MNASEADLIVSVAVIAIVLYATSLHEFAHALMATWLGDPTPGRAGRLTFNPIPHLEPVLTAVVIPIALYLTSGMLFCMAFTPINPTKFRNPLRDRALVSVVGPLMNLLVMAILIGLLWIPGVWPRGGTEITYLAVIAYKAAFLNLFMAVVNLLPIPPLDGYWIVRGLIPLRFRMKTDELARSSFAFIVAILGMNLLAPLYLPPMGAFFNMLLPPLY